MHKPTVSPIARSLWLGALGLGLLLPAPALAAPDLQIDWPEPGGEAKPKAPARAAPTAPPAAPVKRADPPAEAEIEVELDLAADAAPATKKSTTGATKTTSKSTKSTKSSASSKSKSKSSSKRSKRPSARELREAEAAAEREALRSAAQEESARAHRDAARAHGAELIAAGRPREAARELAVVAAVDGDPLLFLAAAEASLAAVDARERSSSEGLAQARGHVASAKDALAALRSEPAGLARLGLDVDTLPAIDAHIAQVVDAIDRRSGAKQRRKVALGEVISGSVLTAIGLSGLGVMSGGLYLDASADAELERAGVQDINALPPNLQPAVRAQVDRASTMIAVGSIVGAAGTALGVTLVTIGARDVKKLGGLGRKRASLRAAPTFGGIVVSGRF